MTQPTPDPLAYGPNGYRCGCGKDAHSNPALTKLHCLRCTPHPAGDIWTPVTAAELEDGGICTVCGVDVLIEVKPS